MIDCKSFVCVALVVVLLHAVGFQGVGQEPEVEEAKQPPGERMGVAGGDQKSSLTTYITVTSPVNDVMYAKITNAAIKLQQQAEQERRSAFLILELGPGTSKFGQIRDLAKELASAEYSRVRTIAWIPETRTGKPVDGNIVILALACKEIVMHPDVELGDIGRGKAVDPDENDFVVRLVQKRHNVKVNAALAQGMMNPQKVVLKVKIEMGGDANKVTESRVVTPEELQRLRDNKAAILDVETIKEAGVVGTLSGSRARALDVLVVRIAETREEIADDYNLPLEALREDATAGEVPRARLIRIDDMIEPILEGFVDREIRRAVSSDANLIIFEIDSPGGFLLSSSNLAHTIADLDPERIRTVAYIPKMALSGAAIIALGCSEIYMHPDAKIGDAGPIEIGKGGQFERAPEKALSYLREILAGLAEKKGRPKALAKAMADKDLKVYQVQNRESGREWYMGEDDIHNSKGDWIKGPLVPESREDNLLTLRARRANELKIAEPPVADWVELKQRLGLPERSELVAAKRTWVDTMVYVLNSGVAMFLLITLGVACIYLELNTMTGFFGIASALCFTLFFWSRYLGGTADWLEIVLFLLGLVLIAVEVFVIPGFGVFGVSGGLLILTALILASQTFVIPHTGQQVSQTVWTLGTMGGALVSVIVLAVLMSHFLPRMPFLNQMILVPSHMAHGHDPDEPRLNPQYSIVNSTTRLIEYDQSLVQKIGVAISMLRPAGKARIGEDMIDVVSEGPFILEGSRIEVVQVSGNRVVVRQV